MVTGTDTGVGKTAVACGILRLLRSEGVAVGAFKPMESGWDGRGWPNDGRALASAAGLQLPRQAVVPIAFRNAVAPLVGSKLENHAISLTALDKGFHRMRERHDVTLVEGSGGLAVPLLHDVTVADLAKRWKLPLLIVARAGLGTLNHTALTVAYARQKGIAVLGIILNGATRNPTPAERTNPEVLAEMTGLPILGSLPQTRGVDVDKDKTDAMQELVDEHVDLTPLRALLS